MADVGLSSTMPETGSESGSGGPRIAELGEHLLAAFPPSMSADVLAAALGVLRDEHLQAVTA